MKNISRFFGLNTILNNNNRIVYQLSSDKYSTVYGIEQNEYKKEKHPYKKIHPWKSVQEFSESLIQNIIYNKDGLVALNKPYGIASRNRDENDTKARYTRENKNKISGGVDYSISNSLPFIAQNFGYENLTIVRSPERYMSGVMLLAANDSVKKALMKSQNRAAGMNKIPKTYWIITTKLPKESSGRVSLALKLQKSPCQKFERPIILDEWSISQVKRREVKSLNVEYKVLSNSKNDLSSLIEIKSSTTKWHAIRLFAAIKLHSPVLGDNIHGTRVQNIMGTWMTVDPFLDSVDRSPKLDQNLLKVLNLSEAMQSIVPVHIHLKQIELSWYLGRLKDLVIEAPLPPEFSWTVQTLGFKPPTESNLNSEEVNAEEQQFVAL